MQEYPSGNIQREYIMIFALRRVTQNLDQGEYNISAEQANCAELEEIDLRVQGEDQLYQRPTSSASLSETMPEGWYLTTGN